MTSMQANEEQFERIAPITPADKAKAREAVFILGMHRSGTSFLTETISHLGFTLPQDRTHTAPDNPRGHFEPQGIVAINDRILEQLGGDWCRLSPVPDLELGDEVAGEYLSDTDAAITASFGCARRIVIKDPRVAILSPFWRRYMKRAGLHSRFVIALRSPEAVAESLACRDGLPASVSLLLWAHYSLAAFEMCGDSDYAVILFPDWLKDRGAGMRNLARHLGRKLPNDAIVPDPLDWFVQTDRASASPAFSAADRDIAEFAHTIFDVVAPTAMTFRPKQTQIVSQLRQRYLDLSAGYRAIEKRAFGGFRRVAAERDLAGRRAEERTKDARALQRQLVATEAQRDSAARIADEHLVGASDRQRQIAATELQRDTLAGNCERMRLDAEKLLIHIAATERQRDQMSDLCGQAQADCKAIQIRLRATEAQRDEQAALHDARIRDAMALQKQLRHTERQRDQMAAALDRSSQDANALQRQVTETEAQRNDLAAHLAQCRQGALQLQEMVRATEAQRDELAMMLESRAPIHVSDEVAQPATDAAVSETEISAVPGTIVSIRKGQE